MLIFSGIMAWISLFLFVILILKYVVKLLAIRFEAFRGINRFFSKTHKPLGILILFTALLHALTSSRFIFSFNLGTMAIACFILLMLSYIFKRFYPQRFLWVHRGLTILSVMLVILHLVEVDGFHLIAKIQNQSNEFIDPIINLEDGVYEGKGNGLKGEIIVQVEIKNYKIIDITVIQSSETEYYFSQAISALKPKVIEKNSPNVDIVVGATYASNGYLEAISNSLTKTNKINP